VGGLCRQPRQLGSHILRKAGEATSGGLMPALCEPGPPSDLGPQFFRELLKPRPGRVVREEAGKAAGEGGLSQQIIERHE
jgi:hypothetical protein